MARKSPFFARTDVVDNGHGVQHPPDVYIQAQMAKKPSEQQQIMEDVAALRISHACRHVARPGSLLGSATPESAPRAPPPRPHGT